MDLEQKRNQLFQKEGHIKRHQVKSILKCIERKEGPDEFKKLKKEFKKYNPSFDIDKINHSDWINEGESVFIILLAKDIFNWNDKDIFELGMETGKVSFLLQLFTRYFISIDTIYANAPNYWKKHFDFGRVEMIELNKEKKFIKLRVYGYDFDESICKFFHSGYFYSLASISVKTKNLKVEETVCVHHGGEYNEYIINW